MHSLSKFNFYMRSWVAVREKSARKNLCEFRVPSQENVGEPLSLSHQHLQQLAPKTHDTPRLSPPQHNYLLLLLSSLVILFFPSLISFFVFPFMLFLVSSYNFFFPGACCCCFCYFFLVFYIPFIPLDFPFFHCILLFLHFIHKYLFFSLLFSIPSIFP